MSARLTRRGLIRWGLAGTGAMLLASCTPKTPTAAPVAQPTSAPAAKATVAPAPTAAPKPAAGEVKVSFWCNQPMARTKGLWESLVKEFEDGNAGIKIETLILPFSEYEPKMLTGLAGGNVGDLLDVHPMHNANMALKGALLALDDMMPTLGVSMDEMTKAWDYNVWRGKRWATPRSDNPSIMMYNRNMVKQAGLTDPVELWKAGKWNVAAFDDAMAKLSKGEGTSKVYGTNPFTGSIRSVCVFLWGNNADVWNKEETKTLVGSPEALKAWEYVGGFMKKGWAPSAAESNIPGGLIALIGQRRMAFYSTGAQFVLGGQAEFVPADVMKEQQLVPMFQLWNGKNEIRNATNAQGIYKKSKYIQESWKWCKYSVSDACQAKILAARWTSPMVKHQRKSDAWLKSLDPNLETPEIWDNALDNIRHFSHPPRLEELDRIFIAAQDKISLGQATAAQAMDEIVPKVNTILQEIQEEIKTAGL